MTETTNETKSFEEVIKRAIRQSNLDFKVCLPVKIEKYDSTKQMVDVKPLLKKKYKKDGGTEVELPVIVNVPVAFPSCDNGKCFIHLPLKKGDLGKVLFADRSLDIWLSGDGEAVSPNDPRMHDLSDAIFEPGLLPPKKAFTVPNKNNAYFKNDQISIELFPNGKIKIEGATKEMMAVISSYMGHVNNGIVLAGMSVGTWLASTKVLLVSDKSDFDSLKG